MHSLCTLRLTWRKSLFSTDVDKAVSNSTVNHHLKIRASLGRGPVHGEGQGMNLVWEKAADRIRNTLGEVCYETWIRPLNFVGLQDRTATVEVPNRFFRDWVNDRYLDLMRESLSAEAGEPVEMKLTLGRNGVCNGNG